MMSTLVLIPWPETTWSAAGRVAGRTPVPLSDAGRSQARLWGEGLAVPGLSTVYSSDEQAATETARIVADPSRARHKSMADFAEVDAGLWDGLTIEELKRRYPKVFKRWYEDPSAVCPPEGERLADAYERLHESVSKVVRKQGDRSVAVVLGPLALALTRCALEHAELSNIRSLMSPEPIYYSSAGSGTAPEKAVTAEVGPGTCDTAGPGASGTGGSGHAR